MNSPHLVYYSPLNLSKNCPSLSHFENTKCKPKRGARVSTLKILNIKKLG
jgi:hypothetical protein